MRRGTPGSPWYPRALALECCSRCVKHEPSIVSLCNVPREARSPRKQIYTSSYHSAIYFHCRHRFARQLYEQKDIFRFGVEALTALNRLAEEKVYALRLQYGVPGGQTVDSHHLPDRMLAGFAGGAQLVATVVAR
jgi:hypothetical protein